jgi:hypothetical protein
VEGGYSDYKCSVKQSGPRVIIEVTSNYGDQDSFDLEDCELLRRGNLWMDRMEQSEDDDDGS